MGAVYLGFKVLHIIAVIAWMAGLLYLPRLFVYHADVTTGSETDKLLQTMERRLFFIIMMPAFILVIFSGFIIAPLIGAFSEGWFHVKLLLVALMGGIHIHDYVFLMSFRRGQNKKPAKFFRIFNEIPTILLVFITILAVIKPF